jgi:hypothetical protein
MPFCYKKYGIIAHGSLNLCRGRDRDAARAQGLLLLLLRARDQKLGPEFQTGQGELGSSGAAQEPEPALPGLDSAPRHKTVGRYHQVSNFWPFIDIHILGADCKNVDIQIVNWHVLLKVLLFHSNSTSHSFNF